MLRTEGSMKLKITLSVFVGMVIATAAMLFIAFFVKKGTISFAETDFGAVNKIVISDCTNKKAVEITDSAEISEITAVLNKVRGENVRSSKGSYGCDYSVSCFVGSNEAFTIVFVGDGFIYGRTVDDDIRYKDMYDLYGISTDELYAVLGEYYKGEMTLADR